MSKKAVAVKPEPKRDHLVVRVMRRGLNTHHTFHGPFTKAEASVYAGHAQKYQGDECCVESLYSLQHHEKWILKEVD